MVLKNGQGDVYYDGTQQAGLFLYADGCGPVLVSLKKGMLEYRASFKTARPFTVAVERNEVVRQIDDKLLTNVQMVSIQPWRQMIARAVDMAVILNAGQYIPIIDLAVKDAPVSLVGKVVECEPVVVEDGMKTVTLRPRRIVSMSDVLKAEVVK